MADDGQAPAGRTVELDAEGRQLQLAAEKAKYIEAIAKAQQGTNQTKGQTLSSLLPELTDIPRNEVTVGDRAGALGPWRAHQVLNVLASQIADEVYDKLSTPPDRFHGRLLIVDERSVLHGDWTARQVASILDRLKRRLDGLKTQLDAVDEKAQTGIRQYEQEEQEEAEQSEPPQPPGSEPGEQDSGGGWRSEVTPATGTPTRPPPTGASGALTGAVDLLGLLRTDYVLSAGNVTATPAELVTLTASHLAKRDLAIEVTLLTTASTSASASKFSEVVSTRDDLVERISRLQQHLAPVEAELTAINARIDRVEQEWATAVADTKGEKSSSALRQMGDRLARQAQRREKTAGPVRTFTAYANRLIADSDTSIAALLEAPEGGLAPLFTAACWERLNDTTRTDSRISHVLYVNLDVLTADIVTRRSILGASGVVRFLCAGNASWLLMDAGTGAILSGGQPHMADVMTLGLMTGQAKYENVPTGLAPVPADKTIKDPLAWFEWPMRAFVLALVLVLTVVGVVSIFAVVKLAFS